VAARILTVAVPAALLVAVAWADGGYYPRGWGGLLAVAGVAIGAGALLAREVELGRRRAFFLGGLVALAAWALVSRAWAVAPDGAVLEAERTLAYAALAGAAVLLVPRRRLDELLLGVLGGAAVVSVTGVVRYALGSAPTDRLELPIGYTNAAGMIAGVAALLGLGLCGEGPVVRRALAAAACPPAAVALYLTLSRGALLAVALGVVVLLLASRASGGWVRMGLVALVTAVTTGLVAWSEPFTSAGSSAGEVAWLVVVLVLSATSAGAALIRPGADVSPLRGRTGDLLAVAAAVAVALAIGAAAVVAVRGDRPVPTADQRASGRLLSSSTSSRGDYWTVAAGAVHDRPLTGIGAGGFERRWLRERDALLYVRDVHNLYLETLAELGPIGLALLATVLLVPLASLRRIVGSGTGRAALAAYVALLAHAALDWDWELPVVSLCTLLLGLVLLGHGPETAPSRLRPPVRAALAAVAVVLVTVGVDVRLAADATSRAHAALDRGDAAAARSSARDARRLMPWAAEPWQLLGEAEVAAGRLAIGRAHLRRATREDPDAWGAWLALAFATGGGERRQALVRARELDPLAPELDVFGADP
jgi:hypothetical protein